MTKKILVLTTEPLPFPGMETTGAGLRAWGLSEGLRSSGFDVFPTMPFQTLLQKNEYLKNKLTPFCFDRLNLNAFVKAQKTDIVILQHWGLFKDLGEIDCPLVIDLAGPHLLERQYWGSKDSEGDLLEKLSALRAADFLICSGKFQRLYFLPFLSLAAWKIDDSSLPVIPFSISPSPSSENKDIEKNLFVYAGRFLPWQNPEKPIRWLLETFNERNKGHLVLFGGFHPFGDVSEGKFLPFINELNKHPRVSFKGTVPFWELLNEISKASVALDLLPRNPERQLAFTSRTMVFLWAGVPVIYNDYSELSQIIERYNTGWIINPEDEGRFKNLINQLLDEPQKIEKMRSNIPAFRTDYSWDKTIKPLVDFCKNPEFRKNKTRTMLSFESKEVRIRNLEKALSFAESELLTLKGNFFVRVASKLQKFSTFISPLIFIILLPISIFLIVIFILFDSIIKTPE